MAFQCEQCDYVATKAYNLKRHIARQHDPTTSTTPAIEEPEAHVAPPSPPPEESPVVPPSPPLEESPVVEENRNSGGKGQRKSNKNVDPQTRRKAVPKEEPPTTETQRKEERKEEREEERGKASDDDDDDDDEDEYCEQTCDCGDARCLNGKRRKGRTVYVYHITHTPGMDFLSMVKERSFVYNKKDDQPMVYYERDAIRFMQESQKAGKEVDIIQLDV